MLYTSFVCGRFRRRLKRLPFDCHTVILICSFILIILYASLFQRSHFLFESSKRAVHMKPMVNPWYNIRNDMITSDTAILNQTNTFKHILWVNPPPWEINNLKSPTIMSGCQITMCTVDVWENGYGQGDFSQKDAIVYSASTTYPSPYALFPRPANQVWAFFTMESPYLSHIKPWTHEDWINQINLTMTYRLDSDIIVNYGITRKKLNPSKHNDYYSILSRKKKLVAFVVSHCRTPSDRETYIKELSRYIDVDIYGKCGMESEDPNLFDTIERDYKFYLSFENALCKDYVTEKFFDIQRRNIISVVRGGATYTDYYPQNTFINVDDFSSVKSLASYLLSLASNPSQYVEFLTQKDKFEHVPGNVYFALCDLCKILHSPNRKTKIYGSIFKWFFKDSCWAPTDIDN